MKKSFILLGLSTFALTLAACSNTSSSTTTNASSTTSTAVESTTITTTTVDEYELNISTPNGAPLIAISGAVEKEDVTAGTVKIISDTSTLPAVFQAGTEDIIVAPVNVGTKLFKAGKSKYKLASVITWGNTYFTSGKENFQLSDMNNSDVLLFGKGSINEGIATYVLNKKGITINAKYPDVDAVASIKTALEADSTQMAMIAEPVLTVTSASLAKSSKTLTSYSIADLYKEVSNHDYPQAAIFVNPDSYDLHKDKFDEFFGEVKTTCDSANDSTKVSEVATKANEVGVPQPAAVLTKAIPGCKLNYVVASSAKADLEFAATEDGLSSFFGGAPDASFYLL